MHAQKHFIGDTWKKSYDLLAASIPTLSELTILDFGCGPRGGLSEMLGSQRVIAFDPYVEKYKTPPWDRRFEVFFSSDVLEHLPEDAIVDLCRTLGGRLPEYIFVTISTRHAEKTFANGSNVHLTVKPTKWWLRTFDVYWGDDYTSTVLRDKAAECTLLFRRRTCDVDRCGP